MANFKAFNKSNLIVIGVTFLIGLSVFVVAGCSGGEKNPDTAVVAEKRTVEMPVDTTSAVVESKEPLADLDVFNFHILISDIQATESVGKKQAAGGTVFLAVYYSITNNNMSPENQDGMTMFIKTNGGQSYSPDMDSEVSLAFDPQFQATGAKSNVYSPLQPGVEVKFFHVFPVPIKHLETGSSLVFSGEGHTKSLSLLLRDGQIEVGKLADYEPLTFSDASEPPIPASANAESPVEEAKPREQQVPEQVESPVLNAVKPEPQVVTPTEINWNPYLTDTVRRLKRAWYPPKVDFGSPVVLDFTAASDGQIVSSALSQETSEPGVNRSVLDALQNAAPMRPIPDGGPDTIKLRASFSSSGIAVELTQQ